MLDQLNTLFVVEPTVEQTLEQYFSFSPTGLRAASFAPQTAFDACGAFLSTKLDELRWQIADWAVAYSARFGFAAYEMAVHQCGLDRTAATIATWASIARSVPYYNRRADLCYSLHVVVSPLSESDQVEALQYCADNPMPVSQFAAYVVDHYRKNTGQALPSPTFPSDVKEQLMMEAHVAEVARQEAEHAAAVAVTVLDTIRAKLQLMMVKTTLA